MWIYTQHGFLSITRRISDPTVYKIRARRREDLERVAALLPWFPEVIDTPGRDYACRVHVSQEQVASVLEALAWDLDYSNFKDRLAEKRPEMAEMADDLYLTTEPLADL